MNTKLTAVGDFKIKKFREILIWPLQVESHQQTTESQGGSDKSYFGCIHYFKSSCCWQETDLVDYGSARSKITPYSEFVYFHPFVQRFLYNSDRKDRSNEKGHFPNLHLFRRRDVNKVRIQLAELDITLDVERVHLYFFEMGIAILVVEISYDAHDGNGQGGRQSLYLKQLQNILDSFRRAYPPYWDKNGHPGHCPDEITWVLDSGERVNSNYGEQDRFIGFFREALAPPVADHWQYLLKPLVPFRATNPDARYCYRQIGDERIPLMAYLAVDDPHSIAQGDLMRLAFADGSDRSAAFPYAPDFLDDFQQRYCYDRYWHRPAGVRDRKRYAWMCTRFFCAGYAFVMLGKDEPDFFTDCEVGALAHFRHHYFQMGLIVHFHKAALLSLSERLSKAVDSFSDSTDVRDLKDFHDQVERILRDFLHFSQRYWFQAISNQTQAIELFEWWSQHLKNRELFEFVRREVQDINGYLDVAEQQKASSTTVRLTVVASSGFIFTLIASFMGMNIITDKDYGWLIGFTIISFLIVLLTVLFSDRLSSYIEELSNIKSPRRKKLIHAFTTLLRRNPKG